MITYPVYLAGEFVKDGEKLEVRCPYSGDVFAQTFSVGKKEVGKAIERAVKAKKALAKLSAFERWEILSNISRNIHDGKNHLATVLSMESGKPLRYSMIEVERAAQTFLIAAEECKRLPSEYLQLDWTQSGTGKEGLVKYFPVGVIAGISPFNFPLNLPSHKIAPALAAGCPIIIKPASNTPLSVLELAKIIDKTPLPQGALSVLPMERKYAGMLIEDERISMISFTGSPEVGWKLKTEAGKKKVLLELGGNAAVIVTETADIKDCIKKSLIGGFAYSGQICIHAQRFFVHHSHFDYFVEKMAEGASKLKGGDPLNPATEVSHMIDEENAERVEKWIKEAVDNGAKILCGGRRKGAFMKPTVLTGTKPGMKVCSEEIFGPVITIEPFYDFIDAIKLVNNSRYGLQASVFTNKLDETFRAFDELEVGGVIINDMPTFRADHMPYGGMKDSGSGREGVKYAIREMMESKVMVLDRRLR